jgi:hypothetical protein
MISLFADDNLDAAVFLPAVGVIGAVGLGVGGTGFFAPKPAVVNLTFFQSL